MIANGRTGSYPREGECKGASTDSEQGTAIKMALSRGRAALTYGEGISLVLNGRNWEAGIDKTIWAPVEDGSTPSLLTAERSHPACRCPRPRRRQTRWLPVRLHLRQLLGSGHATKETLTDSRDVCRDLMNMTKIKKGSKYLTAVNPRGRGSI